MKFKLSVVTDVFWQKGEWTKTTQDKTFHTKDPPTKPPGQKTPRTIEREFVQGVLSRFFVLGLPKMGGADMCYVLLGCPGMCDKLWQGEGGSKWAKNSVTYFMDGPENAEEGWIKLHPTGWDYDDTLWSMHSYNLRSKILYIIGFHLWSDCWGIRGLGARSWTGYVSEGNNWWTEAGQGGKGGWRGGWEGAGRTSLLVIGVIWSLGCWYFHYLHSCRDMHLGH